MLAEFYSFRKRQNSTAAPGGGTSLEVMLKSPTTLTRPALELQSVHDPTGWNYVHLSDFGRYYYIDEWGYDRGVWTASCSVDVLASFKGDIQASSANVLFTSSHGNLQALDNRLAATATYDRQVESAAFAGLSGGAQVTPQGYFALTTLSSTSTWATGAGTTWFLTYQQMQTFARELLEPTAWEELKQYFLNPMDGIIDCYYIPVDVTEYIDLTIGRPITVGEYTFGATGATAQATNLAVKSKHVEIAIPWRYSDFRRLPPYTELSLFVPYCGAKSLDPTLLADVEYLLLDYSVDPNTGAVQAIAYVKQEVVEEFSGNCKISLPVGQSQSRVDSIVGAAGGTVTAVAGFSSGNVALGATGILSAIGSVAVPASQKVCGGMQGSILGAVLGNDVSRWQQFRLAATSRDTTDTPSNMRAVQGNALSRTTALSGLTGYVQTSGAHVASSATAGEIQQMDSMLDAGIYIE